MHTHLVDSLSPIAADNIVLSSGCPLLKLMARCGDESENTLGCIEIDAQHPAGEPVSVNHQEVITFFLDESEPVHSLGMGDGGSFGNHPRHLARIGAAFADPQPAQELREINLKRNMI